MFPQCRPEALALAATAIGKITEELSGGSSEEALFDAVGRHLTSNDEANEVIYEAANEMVILLRRRGRSSR